MHTNAHKRTQTHTNAHKCTRTNTYMCDCDCFCVCVCVYIHTYISVYIYNCFSDEISSHFYEADSSSGAMFSNDSDPVRSPIVRSGQKVIKTHPCRLKQCLHRPCGVGDFAERCDFKIEKSVSNCNRWRQVFIGFTKSPTQHCLCIRTLKQHWHKRFWIA
jgi:hypothetical protein